MGLKPHREQGFALNSQLPSMNSTFRKNAYCFKRKHYFLNRPTPTSFCWTSVFSSTNFTEETVGVSEIQTRIVQVEGEHSDHLTTTMGHERKHSFLGI